MKKKILFFIATLNDGGAQRVVSIISSKLVEKGFNVEILKYYESENIYPLNKKVVVNSVCENTKSNNVLKNIIWIHNYFKNSDIVISFLAPFNIIALLSNIGNKTPIIVADRNDPNKVPSNKIIRKIRDILYRTANIIVVQNKDNQRYFNSNKCVVIENPFDNFKYIGKALKTKKEKKIVTVGRLCEQKNQIMLIEAFSNIKKKYKNYKLEIYGDYESYKEVLDKKVNDLGLSNCVYFMGSHKDVMNKISNAELFVLSSNYEGMPNALIEAMCLGLPVISTKVSGATDLIVNGNNGLLIDIGDTKALENNIEYLIKNSGKRNIMAKNATNIAKKLDCNFIVNKWIEIIKKV